MKKIAVKQGQLNQPQSTLLASYFTEHQCFHSGYLRWLLKNGAKITKIDRIVEFPRPLKPFAVVGDLVTEARKRGDSDKSLEAFGLAMKFIGVFILHYIISLTINLEFNVWKNYH